MSTGKSSLWDLRTEASHRVARGEHALLIRNSEAIQEHICKGAAALRNVKVWQLVFADWDQSMYLIDIDAGMPTQRVYQEIAKRVEVEVFPESELTAVQRLKTMTAGRPLASSGWDPEIFVVDGKGELIPAFEFLPPKDKPLAFESTTLSSGSYGRHTYTANLFWDGFQAEFNVDAVSCHGYGIDELRGGLQGIRAMAKKAFPDSRLTLRNFVAVDPPRLFAATDDQVAFGCEPSRNAYGLEPLVFSDPRRVTYRSAGGHIHFGGYQMPVLMQEKADAVVKAMDRYLALPCVALFDGIDDPRRREFYGRAGEYRAPNYGLEYRVLSNAWLCHPSIAHLVMNTARAAVSLRGAVLQEDLSDAEVQEIINYGDAARARKWVEDNWPLMRAIISTDLGEKSKIIDESKRLWVGGIANELRGFDNLEANWKLDEGWMRHSDNSKATWSAFALNEVARREKEARLAGVAA